MRNATPELSGLFAPGLFPETSADAQPAAEKTTTQHARDFVRWCWNVGGDFRNSPDRLNFRFWQQRSQLVLPPEEEEAILVEARAFFLKKVEQSARKAETAHNHDKHDKPAAPSSLSAPLIDPGQA